MSINISKEVKAFESSIRSARNYFQAANENGTEHSIVSQDFLSTNSKYTLLGAGTFGSVIAINKKIVVKICRVSECKAYLRYARYCKKNYKYNSMLPKVYKVMTSYGYGFVIMERLSFPWARESDRVKKSCRLVRRVCSNKNEKTFARALDEASRRFALSSYKLIKMRNNINTIIKGVQREFGDHASFLDLHSGNVMIRKNTDGSRTVVLTDPIAG